LTVNIFAFSSTLFNVLATAANEAPVEIPTNKPSSFAIFLANSKASSFVIWIDESMIEVSKLVGIKPAPIP